MKKAQKIIVISASTLLILAAAGYGAMWYTQSTIAKNNIVNAIAKLNEQRNILSYESITTHGFPNEVIVRIQKPVAEIHLSEILRPLGQSMPPSPDGTEQAEMRKAFLEIAEWKDRIELDGYVDISVNALSNAYSIKPQGNYQVSSGIGDHSRSYSVEAGKGKRGCDISFNNNSKAPGFKLWNWEFFSGDTSTIVSAINAVHCYLPETNVIVSGDSQPAFNSKASELIFTNHQNGDVADYNFKLNFPEYVGTPLLDSLVEYYYQGFYPTQTLPIHYQMAPFGTQHFSFESRLSLNSKAPQTAPIIFNIKELAFKSDISESNAKVDFQATPKGNDGGDVSWNVNIGSSANEKAYALYVSQAGDYAKDIFALAVQQGTPMSLSEKQFIEHFKTLVPTVQQWGKGVFDFSGNGSLNAEQKVDFNVDNLELGIDPYGLKLSGKGQLASMLIPMPVGTFNLNCRNCLPMVDDITAWTQKLAPLINASTETQKFKDLIINPEAAIAIKDFLHQMDPNATDDFNFEIIMDGKSEPTVNQKTVKEVMEIYDEKVGPFLGIISNPEMVTDAPASTSTLPVESKTLPPATQSSTPAEAPTDVVPKVDPQNADPKAAKSQPVKLTEPTSVAKEAPSKTLEAPAEKVKQADVKVEDTPKATPPKQVQPKPKPTQKPQPKPINVPSASGVLPGQDAVQ